MMKLFNMLKANSITFYSKHYYFTIHTGQAKKDNPEKTINQQIQNIFNQTSRTYMVSGSMQLNLIDTFKFFLEIFACYHQHPIKLAVKYVICLSLHRKVYVTNQIIINNKCFLPLVQHFAKFLRLQVKIMFNVFAVLLVITSLRHQCNLFLHLLMRRCNNVYHFSVITMFSLNTIFVT